MSRRTRIIAALLLLPAAACGGDDAPAAQDAAADPAGASASGDAGVDASGDGWTATFPGEVEIQSDSVPLPGGAGTTTAESTTWESSSEAVTVMTSDLPPTVASQIDVPALLEGTATGNGGTVIDDTAVLDADGTFRGHPAVVYEAPRDGLNTTGLAAFDGARLYQVLHVSRGEDTSAWEELIGTFEFTG